MIKVIGDIMLDRWILGTADRMSPEAPVPVLLENNQTYSIGGAGNLALNLGNLNVELSLHGSIGADKEGYKIIELLKKYASITSNVLFDNSITTTKTRLVGQRGQHICRWDREQHYLGEYRNLSLDVNDIVVVSDYNKGVITQDLMFSLQNNTVFVDPKQQPQLYRDCFLVKPNMKEYTEWFGEFDYTIAREKLKEYGWTWLVVTDGAEGVHVINEKENIVKPDAPAGTKILLEVGDMLVYSGCELEHWREPFEGDICGQVFLHYNNLNGPFAEKNKFDNRPMLGLPAAIKRKNNE